MTTFDENSSTQEQFAKAVNPAKYILPVYLLVPLAFWAAFHYSGIEMEWRSFGLGALGWVIALFLRGPLSAIVMKMPKEKATTIIVSSSGVFERISASAIHIGCTLIVAKYPWTVVGLIPLHSSMNLIAAKFAKKSIVAVELTLALVGIILLTAGLNLYR